MNIKYFGPVSSRYWAKIIKTRKINNTLILIDIDFKKNIRSVTCSIRIKRPE